MYWFSLVCADTALWYLKSHVQFELRTLFLTLGASKPYVPLLWDNPQSRQCLELNVCIVSSAMRCLSFHAAPQKVIIKSSFV